MIARLLRRTVWLALLTIIGFGVVECLVCLGQYHVSDINERFPEWLMGLRAAAILAWAEVTLLWIRVALQPRIDTQHSAHVAHEDPMAAAIAYAVHQSAWALRMVLFLKIGGLF